MPTTAEGFDRRIGRLRADLVEQSRRAQGLIERAVEAVFERNKAKAAAASASDEAIDQADVAIERSAVALLSDATREGAALSAAQLRDVLMVVKINNEVERIADGAVAVAERLPSFLAMGAAPPDTFRVMANSVIGICDFAFRAFERADPELARSVLRSDEAALAFKQLLLRESQEGIARGVLTVDAGFALLMIASDLERMADHACNIAEQVIYAATGQVTDLHGGVWETPRRAD